MSVEEAFCKYGPQLSRHATALVGPDGAADLVSEALLGALQSKGWASAPNQEAYLHRSVLNSARLQYRSTVRRSKREWKVAAATLSPIHELLPRPEVRAAVGALSLRQRSVIYFTYWEDMTVHEVASTMGISEGSVKKHLARGRAHLRKVLYE